MKYRKTRLTATGVLFTLFATCSFADNTVSLSGLESGPMVHDLMSKTHHTTLSEPDALLSSATRDNAVILFSITDAHDVERAKPIVKAALDKRLDVLLEGDDTLLAQLRPVEKSVWVPGNRLFISTRSDVLGTYLMSLDPSADVEQIHAALTQARSEIQATAAPQLIGKSARSTGLTPSASAAAASASTPSDRTDASSTTGTFQMPSLLASTPSSVCISIRNELASQLNGADVSAEEITNAVQRVCQYGTIAEFRAVPADTPAYGKTPHPDLALNLRKEWMLLFSEDKTQPEGSRAYLSLRTLGDDAGSGYVWTNGAKGHAYTDKKGVDMYDIMNTSIYSGWGPVQKSDKRWPTGKPGDMFLCEAKPLTAEAAGRAQAADASTIAALDCPRNPRLLSVLPGDSYDDQVIIANTTGWSISAGFKVMASTMGKGVGLSLSGGYTHTNTSQATLNMVRTSTDAGNIMYRTTHWSPSWEAMAQWVKTKSLKKDTYVDLSGATPLARSLNPAWSIVWQLPLAENAGRTTMYTSVYDARTQWCAWNDKDYRCTNSDTSTNGGLWMKNSSFTVSLPESK